MIMIEYLIGCLLSAILVFIFYWKYKKRIENLRTRQAYWERQDKAYQAACKKPGSLKK